MVGTIGNMSVNFFFKFFMAYSIIFFPSSILVSRLGLLSCFLHTLFLGPFLYISSSHTGLFFWQSFLSEAATLVPNGALIWASTGGERVGKGWFASEEKGQKLLFTGGKFAVVFTVRGIVDI